MPQRSTNNAPADLKHRDWLNNVTISLFTLVNPDIRFKVEKRSGDRKVVRFWNIAENDLPKLYFIANTDTNNNYGYLDSFEVYIDDKLEHKVPVPGLANLVIRNYQYTDTFAFLAGEKVHYPFKPFLTGPGGAKKTISQFVDEITGETPWLPKTTGKPKHFSVLFNPDCVVYGSSNDWCDDCCAGVICTEIDGVSTCDG